MAKDIGVSQLIMVQQPVQQPYACICICMAPWDAARMPRCSPATFITLRTEYSAITLRTLLSLYYYLIYIYCITYHVRTYRETGGRPRVACSLSSLSIVYGGGRRSKRQKQNHRGEETPIIQSPAHYTSFSLTDLSGPSVGRPTCHAP